MKIHSGTYWKQCDALLDYGHSSINEEIYTLEESHSFDGTPFYPTEKVKIDFNGILQSNANPITYNTSITFTLMS